MKQGLGGDGLLRAVILSLLAAPLDVAVESVTQVDTPGKVVAHWFFYGRSVGGFGPMLLLWFGLDYLMCLAAVYGLCFVGIWLWRNEVKFRRKSNGIR